MVADQPQGASSMVEPGQVRQLVAETLTHHGLAQDQLGHIQETLLLREGRYLGRSFRVDGWLAVWLPKVNLMSVYAPDGELLEAIDLKTLSSQQSGTLPLQQQPEAETPARRHAA